MKRCLPLILVLLPLLNYAQVQEAWVSLYDNNTNSISEIGNEIVLDAFGNSYVAGYVASESNYEDFITIKYDATGQLVWQNTFNGTADSTDINLSVQLDELGNVYSAGYSYADSVNIELIVIKYNSSGDLIWQQSFPDWVEGNVHMAVRANGDVFVAGSSYQLNPNDFPDQYFTTLKYATDGTLQWSTFDVFGTANSIAISDAGNVYVSGPARDGITWDYLTIKYNNLGVKEWDNRWGLGNNQSDWPRVMTIDNAENVYVSGHSNISNDNPLTTIKYDSIGNELWIISSDTLSNINHTESILVDQNGNFYSLVRRYLTGSFIEFYVIKHDENGNILWTRSYLGPNNTHSNPTAMSMDNDNNIYIAGNTRIANNNACVIVKYDPDGNQIWEVIKESNTPSGSRFNAIEIDENQNVFVTGQMDYGNSPNHNPEIITVKYGHCEIEPTFPIIGSDTICANEMDITYTTQESNGSTYNWYVGGGVQSDGLNTNTISIDWSDGSPWPTASIPLNEGLGLITVYETNSDGCMANPVSQWISIENCTSVEENILNQNNVVLYPNPSNEFFYLELDVKSKDIVKMQIINAVGQTVYTEEKNLPTGAHTFLIDTPLNPGLYFVNILINDVMHSKNIIKK